MRILAKQTSCSKSCLCHRHAPLLLNNLGGGLPTKQMAACYSSSVQPELSHGQA